VDGKQYYNICPLISKSGPDPIRPLLSYAPAAVLVLYKA